MKTPLLSLRTPHSALRIFGRYAGGFTLIELIFVTMALAVLMVTVMPRFQQSWNRLEAEQVAFRLAQSLRVARMLAVAQSRPVAWVWEPEAHAAWIGVEQDDGSTEPVAGRLGGRRRMPRGIDIVVQQDNATDRIRFFSDGSAEAGTLLISAAERPRYRIDVEAATGLVTLTPAGSSTPS